MKLPHSHDLCHEFYELIWVNLGCFIISLCRYIFLKILSFNNEFIEIKFHNLFKFILFRVIMVQLQVKLTINYNLP
jgi:hypothetical protein